MNRCLIHLISIAFFILTPFSYLLSQEIKGLTPHSYSDTISISSKKPLKAAVEVVGLNIGVWAFDRYAINGDYAHISLNTMKHNLKSGFVWDNDQFSTNLFSHPYQGSLYFNAARSNGMPLREAALYSVGGSLMWEYLMENERPSINDFIATPIGGVCLGEITFRLSDLLIDNRTFGLERFGREFFATLISPIRGFNRIISGEAWKVGHTSGHAEKTPPVQFYVTSGYRGLMESRDINLDNGMYINLKLFYSNIFSEDNEKPYDAFIMNSQFNLLSQQPVISNIGVISQIWGRNIPLKQQSINLHWGVFQHFDYYDSKAFLNGEKINSYKISEAAAFGIGGQIRADLTEKTTFVMSSYLNAVLLGGSITDYYRAVNRDYNIGSGFSAKSNMRLIMGTVLELNADVEEYRLFSWKGYDPELDLAQLTEEELANLNVQGDEGITNFVVLNLNFNYCFRKHYTFSIGTSYYLRNSDYKFFPDRKNKIIESRVGLGYSF